jgi:hypothetical protein
LPLSVERGVDEPQASPAGGSVLRGEEHVHVLGALREQPALTVKL